MPASFMIQILKTATNEVVVQFPPGKADGSMGRPEERDFVETIVARVAQRPVGVLRTKAQVSAEVRSVLRETLDALKGAV